MSESPLSPNADAPRGQAGVRRRRLRWITLLGILVSLGFVWLALTQFELDDAAAAFASARLWPWIPLAVGFYLLGHVVRGRRCQRLVSHEAFLPLGTATNVVVLGYAVNNVLPARLGEIARAGLLSERTGIPFAQSLTVTFVERILDGWTMLLFFVIASRLLPEAGAGIAPTALLATSIFGAATFALALMAAFPYRIAQLAARMAAALRPSWQDPTWRVCMYVSHGLAYLRRPGDALTLAVLSVVVWTLEAGMFAMVLPAFGLPLSYEWAILAMAVTNLGILVPSTPGYVGPFHFFCMQTLVLLGVAAATATSYAIAVHAVFYVPITLWGVGVVMRYGIEIGAMMALARSFQRGPVEALVGEVPAVVLGSARTPAPSQAPEGPLIAITEALVSEGLPEGENPAGETTARAARFVQGQLAALPTLLRVLMRLGLLAFGVLVWLRYLRTFAALSLPTRQRIVRAWAFGPWPPARQLFRPLRSTALLAYYEYATERTRSVPLRLARAAEGGP